MILIFSFNNLFEVLKKLFGRIGYIIMADFSKALKWNLIEQFILRLSINRVQHVSVCFHCKKRFK